MAVEAMLERRWLPVFAEYAIADRVLRLGSAIDVVAIDVDTLTLRLVDLKNGYLTGAYDAADARHCVRMAAPYARLPATPFTHHVFQLVAYRATLERHYGVPSALLTCSILRMSLTDGRIYHHALPPWADAADGRAAVYAHLHRCVMQPPQATAAAAPSFENNAAVTMSDDCAVSAP